MSPPLRKHSRQSPSDLVVEDENKQMTHGIPNRLRNKNHLGRGQKANKDDVIDRNKYRDLPTLVIGGSDGSGTRSFAHAMRSLGVPMKTDLKSNLDIQSGEICKGQGFPPLVSLVLEDTKSVNYEVEDLTTETRRTALAETIKFKKGVDRWHEGVEHWRQARATGVSIGFKAPATMLLLPLLRKVFGAIKYIHVVRDGRDVSLR